MAEKENLHKDHRSRLRKRYESEGLGSFEDHNVLELLLFYAIPRKDTNPIAHRLLDRFGSLHGVFDASEKQLCEVDGIGASAAAFIKLCPEVARAAQKSRLEAEPFCTDARFGQYFVNQFRFAALDAACVLFLDADLRYVSLEMIQSGSVDAPKDVVDRTVALAKQKKALYAVIAHNHGDAGTTPTSADLRSTADMRAELEAIGVKLIAHYIVSGFDYNNFMEDKGEVQS